MADREGATASASRTATATRLLTLRHLQDRLRSRFLLGVPWGTLLLCSLLGGVYLFVQGGLYAWAHPLTIPFTSWSYRHPLGVLLGPVAHQGPRHLLRNLIGALVFGSIAEYVYGHTPANEGSDNAPAIRAFVVFPVAALLAGAVASAFSWGPTIGFSNVVYAFAGVALVRYPIGSVVALSVEDALSIVVRAVEEPLFVAGRTSTEPWFVDTAVQSHTFGLLLGVTAGTVLLTVRDTDPPSPFRLWTGITLFAFAQSLWVVWWPWGTAYVLARGMGVFLVACLGTLITIGTVVATRGIEGVGDERARQAGLALLAVPLIIMAGIAVPINVTADVTVPPETEPVAVDGYAVAYAESVPNQRLAPFAAVTGEQATTSGVLVVDPDRGIWTRAVSADRLERDRVVALRLGEPGRDRAVFVVRRGWRTAGGETAFQVWVNPEGGGFHRVYASSPARAEAVIAGYNVSVVPSEGQFRLRITRGDETVRTAPIPDRGENVTLGSLKFNRDSDRLVAVTNSTRVPVATRQ